MMMKMIIFTMMMMTMMMIVPLKVDHDEGVDGKEKHVGGEEEDAPSNDDDQ